MEKDLLKKILQNYPSSSVEEAKDLHSMRETYPYSQLLHVLAARTSKEHGFAEQLTELQLAAVYSADRAILKNMMSDAFGNGGMLAANDEAPNITAAPIVESLAQTKEKKTEIPLSSANESDDLAEKVIKDVTALYNARHNFEMMFVDNPGADLKPTGSGDDHAKTKRERIIELSKALNAQHAMESEETKNPKRKHPDRKDIIDEIVDTKSQIEPANEKQKEQLEIIEQFIKTQPSISNAKDKAGNFQEGDLSSIKTGEFTDNIVSETLVELLLKQGKRDKAIEVLKKLIWKFPQKKAYFAAQIEELKK
ncbi:MAG TPA: tetratricopeptide repeat protein [Chryseolinea sp.]